MSLEQNKIEFIAAVLDAIETATNKYFGDIPLPDILDLMQEGVAAALKGAQDDTRIALEQSEEQSEGN